MELTSYLLGKKAGGGGGDTPDLDNYFETEINHDTTTANNYASNIVKMTAPFTITNDVTDLTSCFYECRYKGIDVSQMDTTNVTKMEGMFMNGLVLQEIRGIENLNVSNVNTFKNMFRGCYELKKLDLSKWTPKESGISVQSMFQGCIKMAVLDVSGFSKFGNYMFTDCGRDCLKSDGAYADGIPYVYVKDESLQTALTTGLYGAGNWTTANVIVKGE